MTTDSKMAPPVAPKPAEDDEAATFLIALGAGILGVVSLMAWFVMFVAERFSDEGSGVEFFQHRGWFLVAGTGLVVLGIGLQIHRIGQFVSQRRSLVALNVALMTLLALALTCLANYVGARHYKEFDWTRSGVYSISDESVQVVSHLEKPIKMWVIWPGNDESVGVVNRLLDHYLSKSDKITIEHADPTTDLTQFERIVKKLGLEDRSFEDMAGVVVQSGGLDEKGEWKADKSKHVSHRELFESSFDPMSGGRGQKKFKGEQVITNAIIEVTEPSKPKLYFLTGHQEEDLEGQNAQSPSEMGFLSKVLRQKNYDVAVLDLLKREGRNIPDDCSVLVVAGAQQKFDDQEIAAIEAYLKNGGKAFFMMAPILKPNASNDKLVWGQTGLEGLLKRYNVELPDLMLVNFQILGPYKTPTDKCLVNWFDAESKITAPLSSIGARALMLGARPLKVTADNPHAKTTEIAKTPDYLATPDPDAFMQTGEGPGDRKQWPVLVTVEQKLDAPAPAASPKPDEKKPTDKVVKLIVAGDSHWISNPIIDSGQFRNEVLFLNCLSYLVGQERFTKEAVKESSYKLEMSGGLVQVYSALSLLGMPLFAIILGLSVWLIRRR